MGSYQDGANDDRIVSVNSEDPLATQLLFSVFVSWIVLRSYRAWPLSGHALNQMTCFSSQTFNLP